MTSLEICVDSLESAVAAEAGGAQRVELCSSLIEGGLTPSLGLIRAVRSRVRLGVYVMIRPRGGDFLYSEEELSVMRDDIALAAQAGADGVVFGLLTAQGDVDVERTRGLVELARPLEVTFHRAVDVSRDIERAFQDVMRTGADRVLTSGGESTAVEGGFRLREFVQAANSRIRVMAGGGVRPENVGQIAEATGVVEFHAAMSRRIASPLQEQMRKVRLGALGVDESVRRVVTSEDVQTLLEAVRKTANAGSQREIAEQTRPEGAGTLKYARQDRSSSVLP